jgi:DNA polymerase I-like protein with 3'-5' exonuclease and polymerase domains
MMEFKSAVGLNSVTDFKQIELRLLAHLTNDHVLIDVFSPSKNSTDVFVQLTAQWYDRQAH